MSALRFAVETVPNNVGLISSNPIFSDLLVNFCAGNNLEIVSYSPDSLRNSYSNNLPNHDSWILILDEALATFFISDGRGIWNMLTTYPHPHLYIVERAWQQYPLDIPTHTTRVSIGEYLGLDGAGSPTLDLLMSKLNSSNLCPLGGGGLSNLHIMSEDYLLKALAKVLLTQVNTPVINIGNQNGVSLASLVQIFAESNKNTLEISYNESGITPFVPDNFYRATHSIFEDLPPENSLDLALERLRTAITAVPIKVDNTPPQAPTLKLSRISSAKHLPQLTEALPTPLSTPKYNLTNLEFVPTSSPRPHKKIKLKVPNVFHSPAFRITIKGLTLGVILYLGSLVLVLGITTATIKYFQSQYALKQIENIHSNPVAFAAARYLYANSVAFGLKEPALLVDAYLQFLSLSDTASNLALNLSDIATHVLTDNDVNLASVVTNTRLDIEDLYQKISLFDGTLPPSTPKILSKIDSQYLTLKGILPTVKKNTLLSKGIISILPDIVGLNDRAKYLVLFQNNMELRGTGGFVGSYGILSFEKGKLYDFQVYDVYTADGALKGHVEPPAPIKNILGEAKWYLRDSNFDPDFPTSARRAEWFLKKSMNVDVSGTIAVNLHTLELILEAIGSLSLPDYQETVSSSNLGERAQFHAEVNFFPGSTAKKEFLSSVSDAIFAKLKTADTKTLMLVGQALLSSMESSDTQMSVNSQNSERILETLGWNGSIENKPCPTTPCYDDFFYSVDSNFGVNKANYYIFKDTQLDIEITKDGLPTYTATTTWKNTATSNAWPAGSYKNYLRLYLPPSAKIQEVKIGDVALSSANYTISEEHGRLVLSYLITVPINNSLTSTVVYNNETSIKQSSFYTLYIQRQSGVKPTDSLSIAYKLPQYLKPSKLSPQPAKIEPQLLKFEFAMDTDHRLSIQF